MNLKGWKCSQRRKENISKIEKTPDQNFDHHRRRRRRNEWIGKKRENRKRNEEQKFRFYSEFVKFFTRCVSKWSNNNWEARSTATAAAARNAVGGEDFSSEKIKKMEKKTRGELGLSKQLVREEEGWISWYISLSFFLSYFIFSLHFMTLILAIA